MQNDGDAKYCSQASSGMGHYATNVHKEKTRETWSFLLEKRAVRP